MSDRTFSAVVLPLPRWPRVHRPQPTGRGIWALLRAAWFRQHTRRCLVELDAHMLKDIGVSFADAEAEANKPFWVA